MGSRRGRGEGAIYQRADGLWCASLTDGYDEVGRRRRKIVYGKTKREVQEKLKVLQLEQLTGTGVEPSKETVAQFFQRWLRDVVRTTVRESTHIRYESLVRTHVIPNLGGVQLVKLRPQQIQALYSRLEANGASPRTRELVHVVLHKALSQAVKWRMIPHNVCDATEKPRTPKKPMAALSPDDVHKFLAAAKEDRLYALYMLAIATGLRQGELLALRWANIDLQNATVTVRFTLNEIGKEFKLEEPKTAKGKRRVDLPQAAVLALKNHQQRMEKEGHGDSWVFCDTEGGPLRRSNFLRRSFLPILERAGLPRIRFHDLRHTAATLLLAQGVHPKVVQERLGHAQIGITLDTYSHVLPSLQKEAAERLDELLT